MDVVDALRRYLSHLLSTTFPPAQLNDLQKQKDLDSALQTHLLSLVPGLSATRLELIWRAALDPSIEILENAGVRVQWLGGRAVYFGGSQGVTQQGNPESHFQLVRLIPEGLTAHNFGQLITDLTTIGNVDYANRKNADRAGARYGQDARLQGHLRLDLNTQRCMDRLMDLPGVAHLRMLCDLKQLPFTPGSLKTLRAELCVAESLAPAAVDALSPADVAARLHKKYGSTVAKKPEPSISETGGKVVQGRRKAVRDRKMEARDKWIYEQCCKGVAYDTIARRLPKKNKNWQPITTKQGILACARKYAERNHLPLPPPRQSPP